ncbi:YitT family protein [Paucidesulfovibrio longus]|uniref:YitT family protein n=1 Tax=Paucidesulfovibrio longus TaxID=889 RepID=UPI0003B51927|nr:YitT family protein [Paucidesulfovibrio longus]
MINKEYTYSVWWNLLLLTTGSVVFAIGAQGVAVHHEFITGGLFGLALFISYSAKALSAGIWYALLSIPLFVLGWVYVSRRFFWYSLYSTVITILAFDFIKLDFGVHNQLYAAVAAGVICGTGGGIMLRSLGSAGGLDVLAVLLNRKYNIGVGKTYIFFNGLLFMLMLTRMEADLVIASLILVFISSLTVEYVLSMFSQRKIVFIIAKEPEELAQTILKKLRIGATFLRGRGAYTGCDRDILMSVINNIQLKRLEEIVFTHDAGALFIVENTFNVLGASFSRRKIY